MLSNLDNASTYDKATLLSYKATILENNQNIKNAIISYNQSFDIYNKLNLKKEQIDILNKISRLYIITEDFSKIIDNQDKIANLLNSKENFSSKYTSNMAMMYFETGDHQKATSYLYKAINIAKKNNDTIELNNHYKDLSIVYTANNKLDSAMFFNTKSLKFSRKNKYYQLTATLLLNKGDIYEKSEDYINAERQYKRAINSLAVVGLNNANIYVKLGNFYSRVYLYDFADDYLRRAIKKTLKTGDNHKIMGLYHDLLQNSIAQKKYARAKKYLKKYDALYEINLKEDKKRNIEYINERYNIQKEERIYYENKNKLQKKESELINQTIIAKRDRILYLTLLILFGVSLLTALLFYRFNKLKIEKTNIQLKNTVLNLQMNPHFIFNSLTAIQNTILKNDSLKSAELIGVFSKLIRQNLDYSNKSSISLAQEVDMLTNYLKTQKFRFDNIFSFKIEIDSKINCEETEIPPMLIQPFVENSIEHGLKHRKKGGIIKISIEKIKNGINISIIDNGIGFKNSKKINVNDTTDKIHAIEIFKERLKIRQLKEENSFSIIDILNKEREVVGTKVEFSLKNKKR